MAPGLSSSNSDGLTITEDGKLDIDTSSKKDSGRDGGSGRVRRGPTARLSPELAEQFTSPERQTPRPDAYAGILQDPDTYLTTYQMAKELKMYPEQVHRWCVKWFGKLPPTRRGKGQGYRIPLEYRYVARGWQQTEDPEIRETLRAALIKEPKNFVVVVAGKGSTHYTDHEAMERVAQVLEAAAKGSSIVSVIYVGPKQRRNKR